MISREIKKEIDLACSFYVNDKVIRNGMKSFIIKLLNKQKMESQKITMSGLIQNVINWADEKNILKKENSYKQFTKAAEEFGEVASALCKDKHEELKDGIGDTFVTLIILAKQNGLEPEECLEAAWEEIKNRTGKTVDGVFIKSEDLK